jgi:metal-responsive CopG/Arc/MetJ family transcriptional regulator
MTSRVTASLDDELKEQLEQHAEREGISKSELVSRGVEYYLEQNSLDARLSELEQRVDEIEEEQSRGVVDRVSGAFSRDRSSP